LYYKTVKKTRENAQKAIVRFAISMGFILWISPIFAALLLFFVDKWQKRG
jgi:hypothetical protein